MRGVFLSAIHCHEPRRRNIAMKLTGAQALIKSLEMEGVEVMFGLPGGAILPVYDPLIDSSIRHILVRHEQGAGPHGVGLRARDRSPRRRDGDERSRAPRTSSRRSATRTWTRCRSSCITGQVPYKVIGTDAFQEARHGRHHDAGHEAQLARSPTRKTSRASSARRSTSRRPAGPARCSSTSRRTSPTRRWSGTGPRRSTCPATSPT